MKIKIKNVAKIKNAEIVVDGIAVIAGENGTGKSTISKSLFSAFNSFYRLDESIKNQRLSSIESVLDFLRFSMGNNNFENIESFPIGRMAKNILNKFSGKYLNAEELKKFLIPFFNDRKSIKMNIDQKVVDRINKLLNMDSDVIKEQIILRHFSDEFHDDIINIYDKQQPSVELNIKNENYLISFDEKGEPHCSKTLNINTEAIYIDDSNITDLPFRYIILPERRHNYYHNNRLQLFLAKSRNNNIINQIISADILNNVLQKLNFIAKGEMKVNNRGAVRYSEMDDGKSISFNSVSGGLKTFIILKTLLINGSLEENGTIILDEPEIRLHPKWQIELAEILVALQKEFNLHILINTHSPYFLQAINVFSQKYGIKENCHYYLSSLDKNNNVWANTQEVTDQLEAIYALLAEPFQRLEDLEYDFSYEDR